MEAFFSGGFILLAILGFAFVIFIHELGHFAFAKWAGVRVEVFSIGFGPIIWSRTIGDTRYALSLLPLGGYVRMLGQEDVPGHAGEEDTSPESYQSKNAGWKAAILFGGVLFNFVSSWLILVALAFYGMPHFPPVVGSISPTIVTMVDGERESVPSPAVALGLQRGDRITRINDETIRDLEDILFATLSAGTNPITLEIKRDGETITLPAEGAEPVKPIYSVNEGRVSLGIAPSRSRSIAGSKSYGGESPLKIGWELQSVGDVSVAGLNGQAAEQVLLRHIGEEVELTWQVGGAQRIETLRYAGSNPDLAAIYGLPVSIQKIEPGSAAEEAGLIAGDILLSVNGEALEGTADLQSQVLRHGGQALTLVLMRPDGANWQRKDVELSPRWDDLNQRYLIGIMMGAVNSGRLPESLPPALGQTSSPLIDADIAGGSIMVDSHIAATRDSHVLITRTLPPETESRLIPLSAETWTKLDRFRTVAVISKLIGFRDTPARSSVMVGAQVTASGPGQSGHPKPGWLSFEHVKLSGTNLVPNDVALDFSDLSSADRSALLSIPVGSYVVSTFAYRDGVRSLEIAIPPEGASPSIHQLKPAEIGTAFAFGIEEPPYELASFGEAFTLANHKSMQMIGKTLSLIPRFFQSGSEGGISAEKSLQGPIGIFSELKTRLEHLGFPSFLRLVALIGLNLFLINLLPIPVTDGGQLALLGIETAIRRPLPPLAVNIINSIGFVLIIMLMIYAVGLDLARKIFG